jgi:hypothetical protein
MSSNKFRPLFHSPEPLANHGRYADHGNVESDTVIDYVKYESALLDGELNRDTRGSRVLKGVRHRFLRHPEGGQRRVLVQ